MTFSTFGKDVAYRTNEKTQDDDKKKKKNNIKKM